MKTSLIRIHLLPTVGQDSEEHGQMGANMSMIVHGKGSFYGQQLGSMTARATDLVVTLDCTLGCFPSHIDR